MIPVLIIGALVALGIAAGAAKRPAPLPLPPGLAEPEKALTKVTKLTSAQKAQRAKVIEALKSARDKAIAEKLKGISVSPTSAKAQETVKRLIQIAKSAQTEPSVRQKAVSAIREIASAKTKAAKAKAIEKLPDEAKQAIRQAVMKSESVQPTPDQAAQMLYAWTWEGGNQGTKNNRSQFVKRAQELMGFTGKDADGIVGPKTRKRAKEFGFTLAPRSKQKKGAVGYLGTSVQIV